MDSEILVFYVNMGETQLLYKGRPPTFLLRPARKFCMFRTEGIAASLCMELGALWLGSPWRHPRGHSASAARPSIREWRGVARITLTTPRGSVPCSPRPSSAWLSARRDSRHQHRGPSANCTVAVPCVGRRAVRLASLPRRQTCPA